MVTGSGLGTRLDLKKHVPVWRLVTLAIFPLYQSSLHFFLLTFSVFQMGFYFLRVKTPTPSRIALICAAFLLIHSEEHGLGRLQKRQDTVQAHSSEMTNQDRATFMADMATRLQQQSSQFEMNLIQADQTFQAELLKRLFESHKKTDS